MRRLKNGMTSWSRPRPNAKMSAPSRKNVRFSGKKSGNRVRLVRRVSTSVSAKSVLTVSEASRFAPSRCVTSRLGWNSPSTSAPRRRDAAAGRDGGAHAEADARGRSRGRSVSSPARLVCVTWYCRAGNAQRSVSSSRWIRRCTLKCHSRRPGLEAQALDRESRSRRSSRSSSAGRRGFPDAVPIGVLRFAAGLMRPSYRAPLGLTAKTYPERPSRNGPSTMRT